MPKITVTRFRDGRQVARFRDEQNRWVRTSPAGAMTEAAGSYGAVGQYSGVNWTAAAGIREVAEEWTRLLRLQCAAGVGSDGQTAKPLQGADRGKVVFLQRVDGKAQFGRRGYAEQKRRMGLAPVRDLWGPGKGGHMLDDIRITYLDDKKATVGITRTLSRQKARANERRNRWWGLCPAMARVFYQFAAERFQLSAAQYLYAAGMIGERALEWAQRRSRRAA